MTYGDALRLRIDDGAIKAVAVSVAAATSGASAADPELVGGRIIGYYPTEAPGQLVGSITLGATGIVTVTMVSSDTAAFVVNVLKGI